MKKKFLKITATFFGVIAIFLGALWFLQGTGLLEMCPVLCFADCDCIRGGSLVWAIVGPIVFLIGIAVVYKIFKPKGLD